ncbi:MAG: metallophosphoesterase [Phycisphaerales bacterium]|nr:MAG: metallophosphoesterase [Phycisphaerales bacterium]
MDRKVGPRSGARVAIDRRRYLKGAALGSLGFCTRWAIDANGFGPEWTEVVEIDLHMHSRHKRLHGKRIAHISDLHHSRTVSGVYLRRCIERINLLDVDIVVLTGDYITYDFQGKYREKVVTLLGRIESRFGAYACLGNHDYGVSSHSTSRRNHLLNRLIRGMEACGITVLRNEATVLDMDGHPLWLVGLGDLRVGDFRPHEAFADVPADQATIALMHNPRGVEHLGDYEAHAVMSGHTHGRKTRFWRDPSDASYRRRFHAGMYEVEGTKLYVNRGLGRVGRAKLSIRPEITIFTLRCPPVAGLESNLRIAKSVLPENR